MAHWQDYTYDALVVFGALSLVAGVATLGVFLVTWFLGQ